MTNDLINVEPQEVRMTSIWLPLTILSLVNFFIALDRIALSVLAPLIKEDLHLLDAEIGMLVGALMTSYAVAGLPIARWADRGSRRNIIAIAMGFWGVMTVLCGAAHSFWQLFLTRVGGGGGEAGAAMPVPSVVCDYVPVDRRPLAFAFVTFGILVASALGTALFGWLGDLIGWRASFIALGIAGFVFMLIVFACLREPLRGKFDKPGTVESRATLLQSAGILWRCRTYRTMMLLQIPSAIVNGGLMQWWPSFFSRVHDLSLSALGAWLGISFAVGSGLGLIVGGMVGVWAAKRDAGLTLVITAAANLIVLVAVVLALLAPSANVAFTCIGVGTFFGAVGFGPVMSAIYSVVNPTMRATAGAIIGLIAAFSLALGPVFMGALSDLYEPHLGENSLRWAMLTPTPLLGFVIFGLWAASKSLPRDLAAIVVR